MLVISKYVAKDTKDINMKRYVKSANIDAIDSLNELLTSEPMTEEDVLRDIAVNVLQNMDNTGISYQESKQEAARYYAQLVSELDDFLRKEFGIKPAEIDTL